MEPAFRFSPGPVAQLLILLNYIYFNNAIPATLTKELKTVLIDNYLKSIKINDKQISRFRRGLDLIDFFNTRPFGGLAYKCPGIPSAQGPGRIRRRLRKTTARSMKQFTWQCPNELSIKGFSVNIKTKGW